MSLQLVARTPAGGPTAERHWTGAAISLTDAG
jgi:hypothetical protein